MMTDRLRTLLYKEFVAGYNWFDRLFLLLGLSLQILVFVLVPDRPVVIVSSIAGVFSVVLCSQGRISSFFFGFIQVLTYLYVSFVMHLYGEVAINVFYFVSMIYGITSWQKGYDQEVQSRALPRKAVLVLLASVCAASILVGWGLQRFTDDPLPYYDAFTTVPAVVAQILMVTRYRDQWYYWLAIDLIAAVMWAVAGNYSFMVLYLFWCLNCCYGFRKWSK